MTQRGSVPPSRRVVSLTCSNTEIVCALGCADLLAGCDDHSDYPPEAVARLPRVGPDLGIDVERVAALKPDLVLASLTVPGHERVVARIQAAGLPYIAPAPESLADVYRDILEIAGRLGVPERGEELVARMEAELSAPALAPSAGTGAGAPPRILVEWWPKPVIVPGRRSWVNQVLAAAGGVNPCDDREACSVAIEPHAARALRPDAVVISWCGVEAANYRPERVYSRAGWEELPAIANRRVYCVPEAFLGRPGPRLVEGCRALRTIVRECQARRGEETA